MRRRNKPLAPIRRRADRAPNTIIIHGEHAEVLLCDTDGREVARAVIDAADVPLIGNRRWHFSVQGYAQSNIKRASKRGMLWMHRVILGITEDFRSIQADHIDGDRLNNRRSNLRAVTKAQNSQNRLDKRGHLPRGVSLDKASGKYRVQVCANYRKHYGGLFGNIEEASEAARELRAKLFTHHNESRSQ